MSLPIPDLDNAIKNAAETFYGRRLHHLERAEEIMADLNRAYGAADPVAVRARAQKEYDIAKSYVLMERAAREGFLLRLSGSPRDSFECHDLPNEEPFRDLYYQAQNYDRVRIMRSDEAEQEYLGDWPGADVVTDAAAD
jgi:hypothetical protein